MNAPNLPAPPPSTRQRTRRLLDTATAGLGIGRGPHVTPDGPQFTLVRGDGASYILPTTYIDFVVCDVLEHSSRLFYEPNSWTPNSEDPPICFSDNGVGPSINAMDPQSPLCETCQQNVKGTAQTVSGQPTTACKPSKKIAIFIPDDPQINLYEIKIGAGSLSNFRAYCKWIGQQAGELDIADFITRMTQDPEKKNTYLFNAVGWARGNLLIEGKLEYIETNHLGDAIVNRTDKPCQPEAVARMLQQRGGVEAALPAPSTQRPQFSLPPPGQTQSGRPMAGPAPAPHSPLSPPGPAPTIQQWQPAPEQVAETRQQPPADPAAPRTRKPRTPRMPKGGTPDPTAQGFQAPAATPPDLPAASAAGVEAGPRMVFSPPGFVPQPGTRLQEAASQNPAPQFGMASPAAPPQNLADAMRMLPPR